MTPVERMLARTAILGIDIDFTPSFHHVTIVLHGRPELYEVHGVTMLDESMARYPIHYAQIARLAGGIQEGGR